MNGRPLWQVLGGLWFILWGVLQVTNLTIQGADVVMALLAIVVGILLWLNK